MIPTGRRTRIVLCLLLASALVSAQDYDSTHLVTRGQVNLDGHTHTYVIEHLPPASFPNLPLAVSGELTERGCLIPQTYEAHRPENVIHGSFEQHGSSDWAALCSVDGNVSLLVFFAGASDPTVLASEPETDCLQAYSASNVLGFNWGIDTAAPETVHEAQLGMRRPPPRLDHDALADSVIERRTIYRMFANGAWTVIDTRD